MFVRFNRNGRAVVNVINKSTGQPGSDRTIEAAEIQGPASVQMCEACSEEPAAIKFNRKGKGHPVLYACQPCANKPEVAGRRRSFTEV